MAKKSSRTARTQQNNSLQKRSSAARPLIEPESTPSRTVVDTTEYNVAPPERTEGVTLTSAASTVEPVQRPVRPAAPGGTANRPLPRRFTNPAAARQTGISREEEYRFIVSDLRVVFILTVLMIVILVVLTFVLGR